MSVAASAPSHFVFSEYPLVLKAARELGHPVKWIGDRTEHFLADAQGRDNISTAELALDETGKILGYRVNVIANMGAYLSQYAPFIPLGRRHDDDRSLRYPGDRGHRLWCVFEHHAG